MPAPPEFSTVKPGLFIWQSYDPTVKADLFSTALTTASGTWFIDPIPLDLDTYPVVHPSQRVAGIFVTNVNHIRASAEFSERLAVRLFAHEKLCGNNGFRGATGVHDGEVVQGLTAISIDGGPRGEMALHDDGDGGTMVIGDSLINFDPHGFGLLPAKYCLDARQMRRSLAKLLDYRFERMLFAHGTPILSGAGARVEQLLADSR